MKTHLLAALFLLSPLAVPAQTALTASAEHLADIPVLAPQPMPDTGPKTVVIYFSDITGWQAEDDRMVAALRAEGAAVITVDHADHVAAFATQDGDCLPVDGPLSDLAQAAERQLGLQTYLPPILAGRGAGAAFAYAAVAEGPAAFFAGAVGSGFDGDARLPRPICHAEGTPVPGPYGFSPDTQRAAQLYVAAPMLKAVEAAAAAQQDVTVEELDTDDAVTQLTDGVDALAGRVKPFGDLPAVDEPAEGTPRALAVVISGDGGWRDLDKSIADWLTHNGVHAVGLDALRYFWSERTPQELARDLTAIIRQADPSETLPIGLIGYSFGADTLPFAWPLLPADIRDRTRVIGLLAPGPSTSYQVTVGGWLGINGKGYDVPTAAATLPADKTVCVSGEEEDDSACDDPRLAGFGHIRTTGGHHFDGDYDALAARLHQRLLP